MKTSAARSPAPRGESRAGEAPKWVWGLLSLLTACGSPVSELQRLPDLLGQVVMSRPGIAVPDHRWRVSANAWLLDGAAGFVLTTRVVPADDIAISLTQAESEAVPDLDFVLDGQAVPATTTESGGDRVIVAHLPRRSLTPGVHILDVTSKSSEGPAFGELALHIGDHRESFRPASHTYYSYLADYLALGVASSSPPQRFGGFLMQGPQKVAVEVPPGANRFVARIHNVSFAPAFFSLSSGRERAGKHVEAGEQVRLELPLDPDQAPVIELEARGLDDGLFHWSVSRFEYSATRRRPPLILISMDTTRRDAVSPWNGEPSATPNLAAFSEVATVFDSATTTAPWTLPSHASMFTGQYPSRHGAGVFAYGLGFEHDTLAEHLSRQGYVTAGFAGGPFTSHLFGLGRGFALYHEPAGAEIPADRLTDAVLSFLDQHGDDPFFLFLNYFDPHFPWRAPPRFDSPALAEARRAPSGEVGLRRLLAGDGAVWDDLTEARIALSEAAISVLSDAYRAEVAFMDEQIGRLFDALESRDLFDRALIVVVADHGELLGEGGFFNHGCRLDPELIRIPMMLKRPGQRHRERIAAPVSVIDVFPTLLAAAGVPPATHSDAIVLDRAVLERSRRRAVHSEEHEQTIIHSFFEHMKVSPHLLSIEQHDRRQVLWPGGAHCQRRDDAVWRSHLCVSGNGPTYGELDRRLAGEARGSRPLGKLAQLQADKLRALGYLR